MPDEREQKVRAAYREKIASHAKWLAGEPGGERASWKGLYIEYDELKGQDLRRADFRSATIWGADLSFADLREADFSAATWYHAKAPVSTQIRESFFEGANLAGAKMTDLQALHASFLDANLAGTDLSNSGFSHSDLENVDLRGARLHNTGFYVCDLERANVDDRQLSVARIKESRLPDGTMHHGTLLEPYKGKEAGAPEKKQSATPGMVQFHGIDCEVEQRVYANGRMALVLVDAKDREQVAVATVNLPEAPLRPGEVFIKDYSENEGMLAALEKAGIVQATGETVRLGFVEVAVAKVLSPNHRRDRQDDLNNARANGSVAEKTPTNQMPGATDTYRQMLVEAASAAPKRDKDKDIER